MNPKITPKEQKKQQKTSEQLFNALFSDKQTIYNLKGKTEQKILYSAKQQMYEDLLMGKIKLSDLLLSQIASYNPKIWGILKQIPTLLQQLIKSHRSIQKKSPELYQKQLESKCEGNVYFKNPQLIYIGDGTTIQHGAMIIGPAFIGKNVTIRKGAYLRENTIIGDKCILGNSVELKNSILIQQCQIAHFNYIGDSILGKKAHFSAGAITSNFKLDGSQIKIRLQDEIYQTDRNKIGALVGDNVEIGCNTILNPGSVVCKNSVIYPMVNFRGYLKESKIVKILQQTQIVQKL